MKTYYVVAIEDNSTDQILLERVFEKEIKACTFQLISSYEDLLAALQEHNFIVSQPDLLLLDIKLKGISGLDILEYIRNKEVFNKMPIVMFSSSVQKVDLEKAYELGANSYLEKPKTYPELKETIKTITNYWLHFNKR